MMSISLRCVSWESEWFKGKLTLTSLRRDVSEVSDTLNVLWSIVCSIKSIGSSSVGVIDHLSELHERSLHEIHQAISIAAFEPFASILVQYLSSGSSADDIYEEFFVDGKLERVPRHLTPLLDRLNSIGNSSRLISDFGGIARVPSTIKDSVVALVSSNPLELIKPSVAVVYTKEMDYMVSSGLFEIVNSTGGGIQTEITLLRTYLFLGQSHWFRDFLDSIGMDQLNQPVHMVDRVRVNEAVNRITDGRVRGVVFESSLDEVAIRVMGLDINWTQGAMGLIISPRVKKTGMEIFKSLAYTKFVSTQLSDLWIDLQGDREDETLFDAHILLRRMIHFVDNYLFYLNMDVIEPKFNSLVERVLREEKDVFTIERRVVEVLDTIVEDMSPAPNVDRLLHKLLTTCSLFCTHMKRFVAIQLVRPILDEESVLDVAESSIREANEVLRVEKYNAMIKKYSEAFQTQMNNLSVHLVRNNHATTSASLFTRLDFNEYMSDSTGIPF
jgi:hypothetical protein